MGMDGDKEIMKEYLTERNMEPFSVRRGNPFGYVDVVRELGHMGNIQMANQILDGTLQHECLPVEAIRLILNQLRENPMVQQIWKPILTPEDFTYRFKCVPKNTLSSY
jgi:hypothetical protein